MEIGGNKKEVFGIDNLSLIKNIKYFELCIEINKDDFSFALINENYELVRLEKHPIKSETEKETMKASLKYCHHNDEFLYKVGSIFDDFLWTCVCIATRKQLLRL